MARSSHPVVAVALGAGGGFLLWLLRRERREARAAGHVATEDWVWPVPTLGERAPVISDGWGSKRTAADGSSRLHLGVDLMYRRRSASDQKVAYPAGSPGGSAWHYMPEDVPALAAGRGTVRSASWTPRGHAVVIDHGAWATYYAHLGRLDVAAGDVVAAGQPIGTIGHDPLDRRRLRHLHFELWRGGVRRDAVDPAPYLAAWPKIAASSAVAVRNGGLVYRPVGARGEPYPDWLRRLKGESGVYVIRQGGEVVYVGESHTGRLYETLTRHFQAWRRWKGFWAGQFAEGHDPGLTYARDSVEVAVRVTAADDAIDEEARLIQRLRPRDNLLGQPELEEVPF